MLSSSVSPGCSRVSLGERPGSNLGVFLYAPILLRFQPLAPDSDVSSFHVKRFPSRPRARVGKPPLRMSSRTRSRPPTRARICSSDGNSSWMMGVCHRDEVTHSIAISYSCICSLFPLSAPSFAIRFPRALKTLCGRLEIVDRRDDHALIRRYGAPSPPPAVVTERRSRVGQRRVRVAGGQRHHRAEPPRRTFLYFL